jgi:hypothetical protein
MASSAAKQKENRKNAPGYLVMTPIEDLIDEGLKFDGDNPKDVLINTFDFSRIREITQKYAQSLTLDEQETLVRVLKTCIVEPTHADEE